MSRTDEFLKTSKIRVEAVLDKVLPAVAHTPGVLHEAMRYSMMAGGKRLRPAPVTIGATRRPPMASCSHQAWGIASPPAAAMMPA